MDQYQCGEVPVHGKTLPKMRYVKFHYKSALADKRVINLDKSSFELQLSETLSPLRIQIILIARPLVPESYNYYYILLSPMKFFLLLCIYKSYAISCIFVSWPGKPKTFNI